MKQKFNHGDLVRIAKCLSTHDKHYFDDCDAIVVDSYDEQYGFTRTSGLYSYTLYLKNWGNVPWFNENHLTLIETGRFDKLREWKDANETESKKGGDIDWIFNHGKEVVEKPHGSSIETLAKCFGLNNLYGNGIRGESFEYLNNASIILGMAKPYLLTGDKVGWMKMCDEAISHFIKIGKQGNL